MMKRNFKTYIFSLMICGIILFSACQGPGVNSTGSEYMPDMAHSVAVEANYYNYYYNNTWGSEDDYYKMVQPRHPVAGTVPHSGFGSASQDRDIYMYGDSDDERTRATNELIANPYKITEAGLAEGKELYNTFCAICHGEKGDGAGYLVRDDGGVYPVQPANFLLEEFLAASNGRYYHSIMYGKNLMGAYKDKMSYEERWQVIHYIRSLQAKETKTKYNQMENTFSSVDIPAGEIFEVVQEEANQAFDHDHDHSHDDGHGEDHGHGHEHGDSNGDHHSDDDHGHEHH